MERFRNRYVFLYFLFVLIRYVNIFLDAGDWYDFWYWSVIVLYDSYVCWIFYCFGCCYYFWYLYLLWYDSYFCWCSFYYFNIDDFLFREGTSYYCYFCTGDIDIALRFQHMIFVRWFPSVRTFWLYLLLFSVCDL